MGVYPPVPILHYKKVYVQSVKRHDTHVSGYTNTEIFKSVLNIFFLHNISREDSITKTVLYGNSLFRQKYKKGFYFNVVIFPVEKICQKNWHKLTFVILTWISTIPF